MSVKWTEAQLCAIEAKGCDLLVSAAAGSGKTAVLTERLIRRLCDPEDPADISRMLIVTFTKAAATELREKIAKVITRACEADPSNRALARQKKKLPTAVICTIDSFCYRVIKENFSALGVGPGVRIADDSEIVPLALSVMDRVIDRRYESAQNPPRNDIGSQSESSLTDRVSTDTANTSAENAADASGSDGMAAPAPDRTIIDASTDDTDTAQDDFLRLCDLLVSDRDDGLAARLYGFYNKVQKFIGRERIFLSSAERLEHACREDYFSTPWGEADRRRILSSLDYYRAEYEHALSLVRADEDMTKKFESSLTADLELMDGLRIAAQTGYAETAELFAAYTPVRIGRNSTSSPDLGRVQSIRAGFSDYRKELGDRLAPSPAAISASMSESAHIMRALYDVISDFGEEFSAEKRRRGIIDYADAENLTLDLLTHDGEPTALAERIASDYDEIYIDEYQDINPVQDAIFSALAHGNRFMVGDIKQSIYRFRGAEPDIFSDYRSRFAKLSHPEDAGEDGRTVFLSNNFRCDRSVTGFVNDVFRRIMTPLCGSALSYTEDDELVCSKVEEKRTRPEARTRIVLIAPEPTFDADDGSEDAAQGADVSGGTDSAGDGKNSIADKSGSSAGRDNNSIDETSAPEVSAADAEAEYVAAESARLIRSGMYSPSDIRILTRTSSGKESFVRAFRRHGVPLAAERAVPFFSRPHILLALALLRTIDNPRRSIPLTSVLLSPIGGFSPEELTRIRRGIIPGEEAENARMRPTGSMYASLCAYAEKTDDAKVSSFLSRLDALRSLAPSTPSDRLIWQLFSDTPLLSCGNPADGFSHEVMRRDLMRLYEYARQREAGGFKGLSQLLRSIDELCKTDDGFTFDDGDGDENAVRIMTMHKSKGLEFPVCFVCGCARAIDAMGRLDTNDILLIDKQLGAVTRLKDKSGFVRYTTPMFDSAADKSSTEMYDEELRILYVALTRARERLYVTAATKEPERLLKAAREEARYPSEYTHFDCASYMKWMLSAMLPIGAPAEDEPDYNEVLASGSSALLAESESAAAELLSYREEHGVPIIARSQLTDGMLTSAAAAQTADSAPNDSALSDNAAEDALTASSETDISRSCNDTVSAAPVDGVIYTSEIFTQPNEAELHRRIFFSYPRAFAARLPAKLSVTSLHPGMLDEDTPLSPEQANRYYLGIPEPCRSPESDKLSGSDEPPESNELPQPDEPPESENTLQTGSDTAAAAQTDTTRSAAVQPAWNSAMHRPAFILSEKEKASSADIGTAVHVFLQFCDWNNVLENGIEAELARLTERGFITSDTAELVDRKKASRFFASPLFEDARNALRVWRELRFNILLPASDYTESAERRKLLSDEQLLIQGIIDCMYISADGRLRLLDYKTDRVPRDTDKAAAMLAERYGEQMRTYMRAAEQITRMPLDRCVIFALSSGREIVLREDGRDTPLASLPQVPVN